MADHFPSRATGVLLTLGLTVVSGGVIAGIWYRQLAPIQSFYLWSFAKAELLPNMSLFQKTSKPKRYSVITEHGRDATLATMPNTMQGVSVRYTYSAPERFGAWLKTAIYEGQTPLQLAAVPLEGWGLCVFVSMILGSLVSKKEKRKAHEGKKLRGPDLISRWQFNRRVKGDGFPIKLENKRNLFERLKGQKGYYLRIERKYENNHLLAMSDPGGGKSSLFIQILNEVERRGDEAAIIYDPHIQYTQRYFNRDRGDIILNPLDERCPPWSPAAELDLSDAALAEAHAMAQATSLFPGSPGDRNWFFTYTSQLIWKYISVNFQPTAHEMAHLMENCEPLIDRAIQGTELVTMMGHNAPNQRGAVVGHLTQIAYALRQLPEETPSRKPFVLKDWCKKRQGWIFVTNTQNTRDSLRPIQSLWLDTLIMDLLSQGERPDLPPVLMALDEMQTLQKLPQLMPLVTEGRKSLRVLMGFQGRSQLKGLYGEIAEAVFSAAFSKFMMRTSEDEASRWVSNTMGDVERERVRETRPVHAAGKGSHSYSTERITEKLLLPSEFHGLLDREGYMKYGNNVVKFKLPIMPSVTKAPGLIPRQGIPVTKKPLPTLEAPEPESEAPTGPGTYVAPPFLVIANNSTVHNAASHGTAPQPKQPAARKPFVPPTPDKKVTT